MDFAILGPLEVRDRGRPVTISGAKQRTLLAVLLLDANRVVSRDRLVEALWAGEPPETAAKALQVHVSQLRKALAACGAAPPIVTRAPGYLIEVAPDRLDLQRFERLMEEARAAADPAAAAELLREALALWRGRPLGDVASEATLHGDVERLGELRLAALEDRIEADLQLGRHGELVAELEAHVAANPLRERLRGQLMLALYRAGRQAEALDAYQQGRRLLVDELGIEPSPALQRLEQAILRQDEELEPVRAEADAPQPTAASDERKLASVLFVDVVDSTGVAAGDPERARALMSRFFDAVAAEIEIAGGTVEKFIGDAVMAAFGAPAAHEDHAERSLHAALAVRARVAELFGGTLAVRVGVNTGEVVAGDARGGGSFVTGAAVNAAARLEQAAGADQILVGERTALAVGDAFELGEPTEIEAKGFGEPLRCRPLERARSLTRSRGVRGLRTAFVGRENELELLLATYRRVVAEQAPHVVTVVGDAGVGKTSVLRELWHLLDSEASSPLRRVGRCPAYGRGVTYAPLADVLRAHIGLLGTESAENVRRRLGRRQILALTLGAENVAELHPLVARERLHEAWVELLEEAARDQPVVVALEDLHWAEQPLLELVERLRRDLRAPLLVLASARPELLDTHPDWPSGRNSTVLWLEPLAPPDEERLLSELLGGAPPAGLSELVWGRAEGNPFFLEEVLSALIDGGVLERRNGGWTLARIPESFVVPDSLRSAIAARVDLLPSQDKAALQAASVVGRIFWDESIARLLGGGTPELRLLEERDFIRRRSGSTRAGAREFAFKHAVTRDVAYESLTRARRARLHAAFADWLEQVGEGRDEDATMLAQHYAEAVRPENAELAWPPGGDDINRLRDCARRWLVRAAELAVGRYAIDEALGFLHRAADLTADRAELLDIWARIGQANALKYAGEDFWEAMQRAIALADDRAERAELYGRLAYETALRLGMWKQKPADELVERWIDEALELAGPDAPARVRALAARAAHLPGERAGLAAEATRLARRLGDAELLNIALFAEVETALGSGDDDAAAAVAAERIELLPKINDPDQHVDVYWGATLAHLGRGDIDAARRFAQTHADAAAELTPHHRVHGVALSLIVGELAAGWDELAAAAMATEAAVAANLDTPCVLNPRSLLACALGCAHLGLDAEARRLEDAANMLPAEGFGAALDGLRLRLALLREELGSAQVLLEQWAEPITLARLSSLTARLDALVALGRAADVEREAPPLLRPGTYLEPFALRALGAVRGDGALVERAAGLFERGGLAWHAAETRNALVNHA